MPRSYGIGYPIRDKWVDCNNFRRRNHEPLPGLVFQSQCARIKIRNLSARGALRTAYPASQSGSSGVMHTLALRLCTLIRCWT